MFCLALASHRTGCNIWRNVSSVIGIRREFWVIEGSFGPRFARKKKMSESDDFQAIPKNYMERLTFEKRRS